MGGGRDPSGENILLDAGFTAVALTHELRGFEKLFVATPGINTMQKLADSESIEVDCPGGCLCSVSRSFVGPLTEAALDGLNHPLAAIPREPLAAIPREKIFAEKVSTRMRVRPKFEAILDAPSRSMPAARAALAST